jgi:UDP-N-acetylmuramyl pentapeptide synthase
MDIPAASTLRGTEMFLNEILDIIEEKKVTGPTGLEVAGLAYDSRVVEEGDAFFCIKGLVSDGHLFAGQAVSRGAKALFVEREQSSRCPTPAMRSRTQPHSSTATLPSS